MHAIFAAIMLAQSLFGGLPVNGIRCDQMEGAAQHIHANLQLFDRGRSVEIPAQVGIPQGAGCLYWVHSHTADGFIHIEAPVKRAFTLGDFFDVWGQELDWNTAASVSAHGKRLSIWVDGKPWTGKNPRAIVLRDRETIVIQNGPPFAKPAKVDWSKV